MRRVIGNIFIITSIIMIIIIIYLLGDRLINYRKADRTYDEVLELATEKDPTNEFKVNWEKLQGVAAWIRFDDPAIINYPVMQGSDNSYYLHRLYNGTYCYAGSIFINADNNADLKDDNTIIYGHNMLNGSMFGSIKKYREPTYGNRKFYIYLPDGTKHTYKLFAFINAQDGTDDYKYSFGDIESFKQHQEDLLAKQMYDAGLQVDTTKSLVSLSTCSEWGSEVGKRVLFVGMEVSVDNIQEPASWYNEQKRKKDVSCFAWTARTELEEEKEYENEHGFLSGEHEDSEFTDDEYTDSQSDDTTYE